MHSTSFGAVFSLALISSLPVSLSSSCCEGGSCEDTPTPLPQPPEVTIVSPVEGATMETTTVVLSGTASDDVSVDEVTFSMDGGLSASLPIPGGPESSFSTAISINENGLHTITVTAIDSDLQAAQDDVSFLALEPNDSEFTAVTVPLPFSAQGLTTSDTDPDYYHFTLEETMMVRVNLADETGYWPWSVDCYLFNSEGTFYTYVWDSYSEFLLAPGEWTFWLRDWYEQTVYDMTLEGTVLAPDPFEPNESMGEATSVDLDFATTGTWLTLDEQDWYTFSLMEESGVTVRTTVLASDYCLELGLYDERGEVIASAYEYWSAPEVGALLPAGTYFVHLAVCYLYSQQVLPYELSIARVDAANDAMEPNDSIEEAYELSMPISLDARLVFDDQDCYVTQLETSSLVLLDLSVDSDSPVYASMVDEDYTYYLDTYDSKDSPDAMEILPSGKYFICMYYDSWYGSTEVVDYSLDVWVDDSVQNDSYEPNNTKSQATPLATDGQLIDLVLFGPEEDWFKFTLAQPQVITASLAAASIDMGLEISIYDSASSLLGYDYLYYGGESDVLLSLQPGTYYAAVTPYWYYSGSIAEYSLSVTAQDPPADDSLEPNDGFSTASPISLPYSSPELLLTIGDQDWFTFKVTETVTVYADIDARSEGSDLWVGMSLLSDQGGTVAYGSSGDYGDPYLQKQLSPGTYYLKLYSTQTETMGDFYYLYVSAH